MIKMIIIIINGNNDDNDNILDDVNDGEGDGVDLEALHQLVVTHQVVEKPKHIVGDNFLLVMVVMAVVMVTEVAIVVVMAMAMMIVMLGRKKTCE